MAAKKKAVTKEKQMVVGLLRPGSKWCIEIRKCHKDEDAVLAIDKKPMAFTDGYKLISDAVKHADKIVGQLDLEKVEYIKF